MNRSERDFNRIFNEDPFDGDYMRVMADIEIDDMMFDMYYHDDLDMAQGMLRTIGVKLKEG